MSLSRRCSMGPAECSSCWVTLCSRGLGTQRNITGEKKEYYAIRVHLRISSQK